MTIAYKVCIIVIDDDDEGPDKMVDLVEDTIDDSWVICGVATWAAAAFEIGDWHDDGHPLHRAGGDARAWVEKYGVPVSISDLQV